MKNNISYAKYICNTVKRHENDHVIYTSAVTDKFVRKYELKEEEARKIVNVNMGRLADDGVIQRVRRGAYVKNRNTEWGKVMALDTTAASVQIFTVEKNNIIGYETAPSILNRIGLSTWITARTDIVTNKHRAVVPAQAKIRMHAPVIEITAQNFRYLQVLDIIAALEKQHIDNPDPKGTVRGIIKKLALDPVTLISYANKYRKGILAQTIDLLMEEKYESTFG